jgi:hypothetical protein
MSTGWSVTQQSLLPLLLLMAVLGGACSGEYEPDERSGRDQGRNGAQVIPLDVIVTDALTREGGDSTDWKKFEAPGAGVYTLEVYWDQPFVRGSIAIADQYGQTLETISHNQDRAIDQTTLTLNEAGTYFVKLAIDSYRSTYSIMVYPGPPHDEEQVQAEEPRPEFDRPFED